MNNFKKALVGTAAATAMAVSATPAQANHGAKHKDYNRGGPSAGEVIAGAVVLGGLAAILTSGKKDRYRSGNYGYRGDRNYRNNRGGNYRYGNQGYNRGGDYRHGSNGYDNGYDRIRPRKAVKKCVRAAERRAGQYGRADVTQIRDVQRTRYGYKVKGRIAVRNNHAGYRGHGGNYHGSYDQGKFTCYIEGRRVSDIRLRGLGNYR